MQELEKSIPAVEYFATADLFPPGRMRPEIEALAESEVDELVACWLEHHDTFWAWDEVQQIVGDPDAEKAWELILALIAESPSDEVLGAIAAGPLEDFLSCRGEAFVTRAAERAEEDPRFRACLRGVWQAGMSEELWARVVAAMALTSDAP